MELETITPVMLTYNEEANLERTLPPLSWADRVVVVDSCSEDGTQDIVNGRANADLYERPFDSFSSQWNYGLDQVVTPWALALGADYLLPSSLIREIRCVSPEPTTSGYWIHFTYCINGHRLRGSLYPPRITLFRVGAVEFDQDGHTERLRVLRGETKQLRNRIYHDDRKPLSRWLDSQDAYAKQEAAKLLHTPIRKLGLADRLRRRGWIVPFIMPLYCLLWKGLLLDGWPGCYYALQRTYAELLLALRLRDRFLPPPDA